MEKKINFLFLLIILFACDKKEEKSEFYHNLGFSVLVKKNKDAIIIFCDPLKINRYSSTFFFGSKLIDNKFSKGYFLNKGKLKNNILFDTVYSTNEQNVQFTFKDSLLIIKVKSPSIGGEQLFPNNYNEEKMDTIIVYKFKDDIKGFGFSDNLHRIKNKKSNLDDIFNEPFIVLNSNKKDSLYIMYKSQNNNDTKNVHFEINKGFVSKKNVVILK